MFDLNYLTKNKGRWAGNINDSTFYQFIQDDLISRLEPIDKAYHKTLLIAPWACSNQSYIKLTSHFNNNEISTPEGLSSVKKKSIDLICFPFGLHWIGNIQKFLFEINTTLKEDGIFICNFAGAGTLNNLKKALVSAEAQAGSTHFPHIIPFIRFDDVAELLKQSGFTENITDFENIELEYNNPIALMKALKNYGESNALLNRSYYSITKSTYQLLISQNDIAGQPFYDQVNLITLISSPTKNSIKLKSAYFFK